MKGPVVDTERFQEHSPEEAQRLLPVLAALTLGTVALGLIGYAGYVVYPRFDLPDVSLVGLLPLAIGAGIACFFSPCSFPLLTSLLGRNPSSQDTQRPRLQQTLPFALGLSLGAAIFLLVIGSVVALAGTAVFAGVVFTSTEGIILRSVVGAHLIALGLIQFGIIRNPFPAVADLADPLIDAERRGRRLRPKRHSIVFGFGYLTAGFG